METQRKHNPGLLCPEASLDVSHPLISVITVCMNSSETIERTIKSVAAQTYPSIELIVIDGGSTDGTLTILERYHATTIAHLVVGSDNGIYDAMNKGVALATGAWIHILNSDDFYADTHVLEHAVDCLNPQRVNYFQIWRQHKDGRRDLQDWSYSRWRLFVSAFLPHPGLIVSRTQYDIVGFYDTSYRVAADHDMILRLTARWQGLKHDFPLTVMDQGGISAVRLDLSLNEFCIVTKRHGLPRLIAYLVTKFKKLWWRT